MVDAFIKHITYYLPSNTLSNLDLEKEFPEWQSEKIFNKLGIERRHIALDHETSTDLAISAARKLFHQYKIDPNEIDFILFCTQSPDYFLPTSACLIQNSLKIPSSTGALDFNMGCSGYIYGLSLAKALIVSGTAKNVLLLTAETYSKYIHKNDKSNRAIFGDAASATLISTTGLAKIEDFVLGTDGSGSNNLIVKNGAARSNFSHTNGDLTVDNNLYMNGPAIFNFTIDIIPKLIANTLVKNNLLENDISKYILHQANSFILKYLREKIGIHEDKFPINLNKTGNTVSSTIPILLCDLFESESSIKNQKWLLSGFGVGYSWGGTVLNFI
jgi:3-oxoacyl-[acyl-carrier-protein] synthase-3